MEKSLQLSTTVIPRGEDSDLPSPETKRSLAGKSTIFWWYLYEKKWGFFPGLCSFTRGFLQCKQLTSIHKFRKKLPGIFFVFFGSNSILFFLGKSFQQKLFSCYWNYNCFFHINQSHICQKTPSIWPNGMKKTQTSPCNPNFSLKFSGVPIFPSLKKRLPTILKGGQKKTLKGEALPRLHMVQPKLRGQRSARLESGLLGAVGSPELNFSPSSWWLNQPIWKMWVKMGSSSPGFGVKIKNIWNHHLAIFRFVVGFVVVSSGLNFYGGMLFSDGNQWTGELRGKVQILRCKGFIWI